MVSVYPCRENYHHSRRPRRWKNHNDLGVAAAVTKGLPLPESKIILNPSNVIYKTAEDGLNDTIKPRLLQAGADCKLIDVIDETNQELTLNDFRIEKAITEKNAKLFIVDPLQAYLGADVDMCI